METKQNQSVEILYSDLSNHLIDETLLRMANVVTDGHSAYRIKRMLQAVKDAKKKISGEYEEEIIKKFSKKNEAGEILKLSEGKNISQEHYALGFIPDDSKKEEIKSAIKAFGEKALLIERPPLTMHDLRDMRMSAADQESLKNLFDDSELDRGQTATLSRVK